MAAPFPAADPDREDRIVQEVCTLLHDFRDATDAKVRRWIGQVLLRAAGHANWWFLRASTQTTLEAGDDVVDLEGSIDRVASVWAPRRLDHVPLSELLDRRQAAAADSLPQAGPVGCYALEAGHRVHLWPAPDAATAFAVLFTRPLTVAGVPDEWEPILLDGVLGFYGRHFDRDALTQDPQIFETRFWAGLRRANREGFDTTTLHRYDPHPAATLLDETASSAGLAVSLDVDLASGSYGAFYHRATDGTVFPVDAPTTRSFAEDGSLATIEAVWEGSTYRQTIGYAGGLVSSVSGWEPVTT